MGYILEHRSIEFSRIDIIVYEQDKTRRRFFGKINVKLIDGERSYCYFPSKEYLQEVKRQKFKSCGIAKRLDRILKIHFKYEEGSMEEWEICRRIERGNNCVKLLARIANRYKIPWNS